MSPIQQMLLGVGAVATKTYVDDIFSTFLYTGNATARSINNGIDLSGEGGLVWLKHRDDGEHHFLTDTVRGAGKEVRSSSSYQELVSTNRLTSFGSSGFSLGNDNEYVNENNKDFASWTFRKAPGFFDVVTYTGNGSARTIAHSLGSVPGLIITKSTSESGNWNVYHRSTGASKYLELQGTNAVSGSYSFAWNDTTPTATHFSLGAGNGPEFNKNGTSYVAYVFAGGESTNTGSASVLYGGASINDYSYFNDSSEFDVGTNFTAECWFKADSIPSGTSYNVIMGQWFDSNAWIFEYVGTTLRFYYGSSSNYKNLGTTSDRASLNQWHHLAFSKQGTTTRIFLDGTQVVADFDMGTHSVASKFYIGGHASGNTPINGCFDGNISNVRVVKDTAVYTSSFRTPIEPLTGITNTVILCCNNASNARGTTVNTTGDYMYGGTTQSSPVAKTDSPFDDPAGFVFGDAGDQNVIKCGSYVGNGSSSAPPEVYLGWEPQWVMVKRTNGSGQDWVMVDSMRGMFSGLSHTPHLRANAINAEQNTSYYRIDISSGTGFAPFTTDNGLNGNGDEYIYIALRRPDGYVGKPPELGTGAFNVANYDSTAPAFNANFAVDFAMFRRTTSSYDWRTSARLIQTKYLKTNTPAADSTENDYVFDYNDGWNKQTGYANTEVSWMWKRHAGFDVVGYTGNSTAGHQISHSLNKTVEMIWIKRRSPAEQWVVGHKGLDGANQPWTHFLTLNTTAAEADADNIFNDTAPGATHFTLGDGNYTNNNNDDYIAMLFASVDGISKVGSYTGTSTQLQLRGLGFTPRFLLVKRVDGTGNWVVFDTTRGWGAGDDKKILLNSNAAQTTQDVGDPVSSGGGGFDLYTGNDDFNNTNMKYIYYAHA